MPKIVINEYDNTKAGTSEYSNFSVVVPGFLGSTANEDVFDENGVYECDSQAEFVKNIGCRSHVIANKKVITPAIAPTIAEAIKLDKNASTDGVEWTDPNTKIVYTLYKTTESFQRAYEEFCGYTINDSTDGETGEGSGETEGTGDQNTGTTTPGEESGTPDEAQAYTISREATVSNSFMICTATVNDKVLPDGSKDIGYLRDAYHIYTPIDLDQETYTNLSALPTYVEADNSVWFTAYSVPVGNVFYKIFDNPIDTEGKTADELPAGLDGVIVDDTIQHYGNQIAYELLGMGYTVLYKKLEEVDLSKLTPTDYTDKTIVAGTTTVQTPKVGKSVLDTLSSDAFWSCLRDRATYDFRYLVTGLLEGNGLVNKAIMSIASRINSTLDDADVEHDGRGDCIALIDIDKSKYAGKTQSEAIPEVAYEANQYQSKYAAVFAPCVTYTMTAKAEYNNNRTFPGSFHYLACAAKSAENYNEWYANAGYTRGVANYTVESVGCNFGEIAIQALEPRFCISAGDRELSADEANKALTDPTINANVNTEVAVNLIVKIKNSYYLWGNRTAHKLGTRYASDGDLVASHFLNVRQLCTTIKKQVYVACRRLTFDPNSNILWINFCSLIRPTLEKMKADQGIKDYKILKTKTDRKALLSAKIRIVPIEAVEDFYINLYLEDLISGADVSEEDAE